MNILHVMPDLDPATGGPVFAVLGMAAAQAELGHSVVVAATGDVAGGPSVTGGINARLFPCSLPAWKFSAQLGKTLPKLIKDSDIVHIHTMWGYPSWIAARVCSKMGKPYILRPCGMLDKWSLSQKAWKKKVYLRLAGNRMLSASAAIHYTSAGEMLASIPENKRRTDFVSPVGLPRSAWERPASLEVFYERFPETSGRRLVLYLGRLHYKKQPDVAIRAFQLLISNCPDAHLVMAGDGESGYVSSLKDLVKELKLQGHVTFTGTLQGLEKQAALSVAKVFLLPSLRENFGIAVAEAMAAGCPVVVAPGVDIAEDVRRAEAGLVCDPEPSAFCAGMEKILNMPGLAGSMGENGKKLTREKYDWGKVAQDLVGIYGRLISAKRYN